MHFLSHANCSTLSLEYFHLDCKNVRICKNDETDLFEQRTNNRNCFVRLKALYGFIFFVERRKKNKLMIFGFKD